jgi:predicted DNA-binding transcriptional regulator AlpA
MGIAMGLTQNRNDSLRLNGNSRGPHRPPGGPSDVAIASPERDFPLLLTAGEVARLLNISERSVFRLRSAGDLPKEVEVLGSVRWRRADIEAWVAAGCPKRENSQ